MKKSKVLFFFLAFACISHATVTIQFQAGNFTDRLGNSLADGALGALVVDTSGAGFAGLVDGSSDLIGSNLLVGESLGAANVVIIGLLSSSDIGTGAGAFADTFSVSYTGGISQGDNFGLYWFPSISVVGTTVGNSVDYGFYRSDTVDSNAGADIAFVAPVDGFSYSLFTFDDSIDGSAPTALSFQAEFTTTAVPEPSAFALLAGVFGLVMVASRRRR